MMILRVALLVVVGLCATAGVARDFTSNSPNNAPQTDSQQPAGEEVTRDPYAEAPSRPRFPSVYRSAHPEQVPDDLPMLEGEEEARHASDLPIPQPGQMHPDRRFNPEVLGHQVGQASQQIGSANSIQSPNHMVHPLDAHVLSTSGHLSNLLSPEELARAERILRSRHGNVMKGRPDLSLEPQHSSKDQMQVSNSEREGDKLSEAPLSLRSKTPSPVNYPARLGTMAERGPSRPIPRVTFGYGDPSSMAKKLDFLNPSTHSSHGTREHMDSGTTENQMERDERLAAALQRPDLLQEMHKVVRSASELSDQLRRMWQKLQRAEHDSRQKYETKRRKRMGQALLRDRGPPGLNRLTPEWPTQVLDQIRELGQSAERTPRTRPGLSLASRYYRNANELHDLMDNLLVILRGGSVNSPRS